MDSPLRQWCENNAQTFSGQLLFQEPLSRHTYYRIGGPTPVLAFPKTKEDLVWLSRAIRENQCRYIVLGLGSNVLVSDQGHGPDPDAGPPAPGWALILATRSRESTAPG